MYATVGLSHQVSAVVMNPHPVVVVTRKLPAAVEARVQRDYTAILNPPDVPYPSATLLAKCAGAHAILACHTDGLSADVIAQLPDSIRAIGNISVGTDHVDLKAAAARGIIVTNTPGVLANATAELTILLILGAARRAAEGQRMIRSGEWNSWSPSFMLGTEVTGKRLGIVGMGGVGQVTARRARGFDMEIHYYNRHRLDARTESGATYHENLDTMLAVSAVLALHCPATPETERLIDSRKLALLPDGAIVVNAARGSVVDEAALVAALQSGKLAAAGLDVFDNEPHIDPIWRQLDNVFLLPHVGSATRETRSAMGFMMLDDLDAIFAGREPKNRVA